MTATSADEGCAGRGLVAGADACLSLPGCSLGVVKPPPCAYLFFGTGVLGGFTTFSTYAVDIQQRVDGHDARTGLAYLALLVAVASVWTTANLTRRVIE